MVVAGQVAVSCKGKEIAPEFEKPVGVEFKDQEDCTCLKKYVCCPDPCDKVKSEKDVCNDDPGCEALDGKGEDWKSFDGRMKNL